MTEDAVHHLSHKPSSVGRRAADLGYRPIRSKACFADVPGDSAGCGAVTKIARVCTMHDGLAKEMDSEYCAGAEFGVRLPNSKSRFESWSLQMRNAEAIVFARMHVTVCR